MKRQTRYDAKYKTNYGHYIKCACANMCKLNLVHTTQDITNSNSAAPTSTVILDSRQVFLCKLIVHLIINPLHVNVVFQQSGLCKKFHCGWSLSVCQSRPFLLRCWMACGNKLLHSLDVRARMLQYLFPDGRRVKSGCGQPRCWWLFGCSMWCKFLLRTEERPQWSSLLSSLSFVGSYDPRRCIFQTR